MKNKILVTAAASFLLFATTSFGQVNPHAIGARLGGGNHGNGLEFSYQHGLSSSNRLEADLGFNTNSRHTGLGVAGIYHWVWNITDEFKWFVGPGAALGIHSNDDNKDQDGIGVGVGGQIGLEFDFQKIGAPILLGLDVRPMWHLGGYSGFGSDGALSIRYIF